MGPPGDKCWVVYGQCHHVVVRFSGWRIHERVNGTYLCREVILVVVAVFVLLVHTNYIISKKKLLTNVRSRRRRNFMKFFLTISYLTIFTKTALPWGVQLARGRRAVVFSTYMHTFCISRTKARNDATLFASVGRLFRHPFSNETWWNRASQVAGGGAGETACTKCVKNKYSPGKANNCTVCDPGMDLSLV